jgi:hypothetical protein
MTITVSPRKENSLQVCFALAGQLPGKVVCQPALTSCGVGTLGVSAVGSAAPFSDFQRSHPSPR